MLGSGSSGNAIVVESLGERLVVDAGIGLRRAVEAMRAIGGDLVSSKPPLGIVITHEHGDHASHAMPLARALCCPVYAHVGIRLQRSRRRVEVRPYAPARPLEVGPFVVDSASLPHDAPHVALRVCDGKHRVALATDLGHAPGELHALLAGADLVLLEANYCPEMLSTGPYPLSLQRRVAGPMGHLANDQAADVAASLEDTRVSKLVLAHLSRTNNTPARALDVVGSRVRRLAVEVLAHGEPRRLEVERDGGAREPARAPRQLSLAF